MSRLWIAFFFVLLPTSDVGAQPLTRVMSGYAATSGPHAVLWLAREAGLFEKNGLRTVAIRDPRAQNFSPETFMDLRFVKQLEDSGFIPD